jgi:hypothetical protein
VEEEDGAQGHQGREWGYVLTINCSKINQGYLVFDCQHHARRHANLVATVITDPEDSRFDLEAFLKMKAGEL